MIMKKIIIEITALLLCLILIFTVTSRIGFVLIPERHDFGGTWNMYLEEPKDSIDLMFLGSSHAYCNIIPASIHQSTGISSYVLSAPCLTMPLAYYYLKEGLKTQSPKVIMLECTAFFFNRYMGQAKAAIGYMPRGYNRLMSTLSSAEPSERLGLFFPLYNYHDRWDTVPVSSFFTKRADQNPDINAGYTYLNECKAQQSVQERVFEYTNDDLELQKKYLKKIIELCKKEGIRLEIFIAPACLQVSQADMKILKDCAQDTQVVDFNDNFDGYGFDLGTDFYDSRHLNFSGAVKFTTALCEYVKKFDLETKQSALWDSRVKNYNKLLGDYELKN